ncbi:cob(I)yrinic acid a,c-diamide adenosyltransferase [Longirhabdus pacifica]|uniref:cob(I)yrinic acid a,c-diamide adenosyltransferase n=1 Tax=Longirhabdus pacifica TaxID=2305227 RepID=UPI0010092C2B|nr:cob(I)yrinic acid a,c-diamide adenosyltransferase [Longirhabdus pacifica]
MKLYTRTGDKGKTSLIGGVVQKDNARVEAYGTLDELNSFVGEARSIVQQKQVQDQQHKYDDIAQMLLSIQHELFDCGADLAALKEGERGYKIQASQVEQLEHWIDEWEAQTEPITKFILPGGTDFSSKLHVCRTVCRRAERRIVTLCHEQDINDEVLKYVNRLSDLFFVLARVGNALEQEKDVAYIRSAEVFPPKK